jgi:hypothetical protein
MTGPERWLVRAVFRPNPERRIVWDRPDPPLPGNALGWWIAGLLCLAGVHTQQCENYGLCPYVYRCERGVGWDVRAEGR